MRQCVCRKCQEKSNVKVRQIYRGYKQCELCGKRGYDRVKIDVELDVKEESKK